MSQFEDQLMPYWQAYKSYFNNSEKFEDESYKWKALKLVSEKWKWNVSSDFKTIFEEAFKVSGPQNLWSSNHFYPVAFFKDLLQVFPDKASETMSLLFDESIMLQDRLKTFVSKVEEMRSELAKLFPDRNLSNHFHSDIRAISLYLSLQYPEKYFIYKSGHYIAFLKILNEQHKGSSGQAKYLHFLEIANQVRDFIKSDDDFMVQYRKFTDEPDYYNDTYLNLLVQDFIFFCVIYYKDFINKTSSYWVFQGNPKIYDVVGALNEKALKSWTVSAHKDKIKPEDKVILWITGNNSGCYALATVTSEIQNREEDVSEQKFYTDQSKLQKTDRVSIKIDYNLCDRPILKSNLKNNTAFAGFNAGNQGTTFTATHEQYQMFLDMADTKKYPQYWLYSPGINSLYWDEFFREGIMAIGDDEIGDLQQFHSKEEIQKKLQETFNTNSSKVNDTKAHFDFKINIRLGDKIICKRGVSEYIGYGTVISDYFYDPERQYFRKCRKVRWQKKGNWSAKNQQLPQKVLTLITDNNHINELLMIFNSKHSLNQILFGPPGTGKTYNTINKAVEIANPRFDLNDRAAVKKEFERLSEEGVIGFVSFHQSMSYEDFIEGIKPLAPDPDSQSVLYDIEDGIFKMMSNKAESNFQSAQSTNKGKLNFDDAFEKLKDDWEEDNKILFPLKTEGHDYSIIGFTNKSIQFRKSSGGTGHTLSISTLKEYYYNRRKVRLSGVGIYYPGILNKLNLYNAENKDSVILKNYVLIIDEINRGNISQIFGELITLIEEDKRLGNKEALEVILPYSKEKFGVPQNLYIIGTMNTADRSIEALDTALRRRFTFVEMPPIPEIIREHGKSKGIIEGIDLVYLLQNINSRIEKLLDKDHQIGHSYFLDVEDMKTLKFAFKNKILPLLEEYFYGDMGKIGLVLGNSFVREKNAQYFKFAGFSGFDADTINDLQERKVFEITHENEWEAESFKMIYE